MRKQVRHHDSAKLPADRLTWDSRWPAPFESIWSIVTKICRLNLLTLNDFIPLVARPHQTILSTSGLFLKSDWVDFEKLARMLGVDENRVRGCFLDQLFMWQDASHDAYQPRQCPQCASAGYHCVLFDLAIIEECPWHREKLTRRCSICGAPRVIDGNFGARKLQRSRCIECSAPYFDVEELIALPAMSDKLERAIRRDVDGFLDWWLEAFARSGTCGLLSGLMNVNPDFHGREIAPLQLGLAMAFAQLKRRWKFNVQPVRSRYFSWERNVPVLPSEELLSEVNAGLYRSYRAIRRHIRTHFLKGHEHCVRFLTSLDRDEAFCLHGDRVCVVALAFLVWRMSIESSPDIQELDKKRIPRFFLRLHGSDQGIDVSEQPHWFYCKFFLIWETLNRYLCHRKLKLRFDGPFYALPNEFSGIEEVSTNGVRQRVVHLVPDGEALKAELPPHQKKAMCNFLDYSSLGNRRQWAQYRLEVGTKRLMFASRPGAHIGEASRFHWLYF